jgi:hypothetical protein
MNAISVEVLPVPAAAVTIVNCPGRLAVRWSFTGGNGQVSTIALCSAVEGGLPIDVHDIFAPFFPSTNAMQKGRTNSFVRDRKIPTDTRLKAT